MTLLSPSRILVTGAAGRLGSAVASLLHESGCQVLGTDIVAAADQPFGFEAADLRDHETARALLEGIDVLVHVGNHPGLGNRPPQLVFNENVAMNSNVFQGAAEQKVSRIVFASTLQLIGSHVDERTVVNAPKTPSYPLDGSVQPDPSNMYALSKTVSEVMLRYYAERCGVDGVAIRFPLLHNNEDWVGISSGDERFTHVLEGFSGLTYADAAALVLAVIQADLPGYRVYLPGRTHRHRDLDVPELLGQFYPTLDPSLVDLIDNSIITEETGWLPSAVYGHQPQT